MNKEEDYASDSDQSDEDFCPDKEIHTEALSEEDSDDPISDNEAETTLKKKPKARKKSNKKITKAPDSPPGPERVVGTRNRVETEKKATIEKDGLESDDEDPSKKDALWADFLSDVSTPAVHGNKQREAKPLQGKKTSPTAESKSETKEPEKVVISEVFDFAGEEVRVEKTVSVDSLKQNDSKKTATPGPAKRPASGGLGSILGQIGKKKKISVLEKTKLDWDTFKSTEGIEEDLRTFNKGKDGYLQRQDFLERTDHRQFEIEKSIRQARRKPL